MNSDPSSFFVTGGALSTEAPSYVPRRADRELVDALYAGEFCYVLTARQMGKSSLMVRTVAVLRARDVEAAVVDLTAIGLQVTAEQWYRGVLTELGEQLGLEAELQASWAAHAGMAPTQRWLRALRDVSPQRRGRPTVIFIDEIDAVRSLPFPTDDFFAAIRQIYNHRARDPALKLTFCLLGVASPTDLIAAPALTPFNVGRRVELTDFTEAEAAHLAAGFGRPPAVASALLRRVLYWTGAHPYLTQRLCQAVALDGRIRRPGEVDRCCHDLFLSAQARDRDDNLIFVREHLLTRAGTRTALLDLYAAILRGDPPPDDGHSNPLVSELQLSGIVAAQPGPLRVRNRIYEHVFDRAWVARHLPDGEIRRQRLAFRRGVQRASWIAALVLGIVLAATAVVVYQHNLLRGEQALSRRLLYGAEINLAAQAWEAASAGRTAALLERHVPRDGQLDLRGFEWYHLWWLVYGDPPRLSGTVNNGTVVAYGPDGLHAAVSGWNGVVDVWHVASQRLVTSLPSRDQEHINDLAFSPDGRLLATVGEEGKVRVWDLRSRAAFDLSGHHHRVRSVAFAPDGRTLATGSFDRTIRLWDLPRRSERSVLRGHTSGVNAVRFSADGSRLVSAGWDATARLWDVARGAQLAVFQHDADVEDAVFTPDDAHVVTGGWEGALSLWDAATFSRVRWLEGHTSLVMSLAAASDGTLASSSIDGTIRLWDLGSGRERTRLRAVAGRHVRSVSFAPGGRQLATVSDNGVLRFWEVNAGDVAQEAKTLRGHTGNVTCVAFSPDEGRLITGSRDGTARIWTTRTGEPVTVLRHDGIVNAVEFSPDGRTIVTADDGSGMLSVWDARSGARLRSVRASGAVAVPRFTVDGRHVVAISGARDLFVWRADTWTVEARKDTGVPLGRIAAVSPDGSTLVTANDSGTIRFWSLPSLVERASSSAHSDLVSSIRFSPDGAVMATGSFDGSVRLWDWRAATPSVALQSHQGWIGSVAFSPDGRRIVTGGHDGTIKFWSAGDQQELVSFQRHRDLVSDLAFTRSGEMLVSTGGLTALLWSAPRK